MEKKVTVVIPNFNGANILAKNLPMVIANCPNAQIIVVDDASKDNSVTLLHKKFKKVRVIRLKKNNGFANAANTGVIAARTKLVLLLNSDVSPRKGFLKPALKFFQSDKKTFAVGLCDYSHENGRLVSRGKGGGFFSRGFVNHFAASTERGETLWASGGSSVVARDVFIKLGGYDTVYKPFYWEDIDLGFRAIRSGFRCYFEPLSKVDHYHEEGAIFSTKSKAYIKAVSYKNQFLFVWKNIEDVFLVAQHLAYLPFHLARAIVKADYPFYIGLSMAIMSIPKLILNKNLSLEKYHVSEKEVFSKFEK